MTTPAAPPEQGFAVSTRIMAGALIGALFFIALALFFVLDDTLSHSPDPLVVGGIVVAGVAVHMLLEAVGYRVQPLPLSLSEEEARAKARAQWQQAMVLRFAFADFVAIASVALAFILHDGGFWIYATGMAVSLVLMWLHVWPGARPVGKVADALERDGRSSGLREAFGVV